MQLTMTRTTRNELKLLLQGGKTVVAYILCLGIVTIPIVVRWLRK